jgi:hypothetical protein
MASRANEQKNDDIHIIDLTPDNIADYGVCGYKDVKKHLLDSTIKCNTFL